MSNIKPEVTDQLVEYLYSRTAFGDDKYGTPLLPWDGRDTDMDVIEEASDMLQYLWKRRMEREACAELLEGAAYFLELPGPRSQEIADKCRDMAAKLRADVKRSVPVDRSAICDGCGAVGAPYDLAGIDACQSCYNDAMGVPGPAERLEQMERES